MNKKKIFLYCMLVFLIILFISIIVIVILNNNKIEKYDDYKINEISKYLDVNTRFYDGIQENLKTLGNNIIINEIDDIELNKLIASYVVRNVVSNSDYGYDECNICFKYFPEYSNIKFYNLGDIDNIYYELFGKEFKKINQDDLIDYNVIYYNKDIDKYYINVAYNTYKPSILFEFKNYSYEDDMLYLDYYYSNVVYDEEDKNKIYLYNINDFMVKELFYSDLYNEDNVVINYDNYVEYFDVIRYVFKYDKKIDKYLLNEIKILED